MTDTRRPDPLTAQGDPTWLNPATIKGAVAVAAGLLFGGLDVSDSGSNPSEEAHP
jgi:hypothetical protein